MKHSLVSKGASADEGADAPDLTIVLRDGSMRRLELRFEPSSSKGDSRGEGSFEWWGANVAWTAARDEDDESRMILTFESDLLPVGAGSTSVALGREWPLDLEALAWARRGFV